MDINAVIDPGCFRVAYTWAPFVLKPLRVIDPGHFRVVYTLYGSITSWMPVIDPGHFRVVYTWISKTSLYNKV